MLLGLGLRSVDAGHDHYGGVSLGRTGDHVLDEVPVTGGVNDGEVVLVSHELLVGNVDGDTALPFLLQVVHDPRELEGCLTLLFGEFLVFFDDELVYRAGLEQHPTDCGGLSVIDMTDEHNVHVGLF